MKNADIGQNLTLKTLDGYSSSSVSVQSPFTPNTPPAMKTKVVEFVVPEGYKRLDFAQEVVTTSMAGAQPKATWVEKDNLKDGKIHLWAIAYPNGQNPLGNTGSVSVSNVTAEKE